MSDPEEAEQVAGYMNAKVLALSEENDALQQKYDAMLDQNVDLVRRVEELQTMRAKETVAAERREIDLKVRVGELRDALEKAAAACVAMAEFALVLAERDD